MEVQKWFTIFSSIKLKSIVAGKREDKYMYKYTICTWLANQTWLVKPVDFYKSLLEKSPSVHLNI